MELHSLSLTLTQTAMSLGKSQPPQTWLALKSLLPRYSTVESSPQVNAPPCKQPLRSGGVQSLYLQVSSICHCYMCMKLLSVDSFRLLCSWQVCASHPVSDALLETPAVVVCQLCAGLLLIALSAAPAVYLVVLHLYKGDHPHTSFTQESSTLG